MIEGGREAWPDEEWQLFVLGVDTTVGTIRRLTRILVDEAPPLPDLGPDAPSEELVDAALGLETLCLRLSLLLDRVALAAPPPSDRPPSSPGDLLR